MTIETETHTYTLEEFYQWVNEYGEPERQYELINGEIVEMNEREPGPSGRHGEVMLVLGQYLLNYVRAHKLGRVFVNSACTLGISSSSHEVANSPKTSKKARTNYLVPDVLFVRQELLQNKFEGPIPVLPDLIAEINSPSDTTEAIRDKIAIYKKAGVRLLWSIYLLEEYVVVYRLDEPKRTFLNPEDELDGEDILPGFKLKVSALFEQPLADDSEGAPVSSNP